jgi:hypothetical protein
MRLSQIPALAAVLAVLGAPLAAETVAADPAAKVDYSGTLKVLTKFGAQRRLCCTNRVTGGLPLSPDRLILRLQLRVCRAR